MAKINIVADTWAAIAAGVTKVTFQNQTRGNVWIVAADGLPVGGPDGLIYPPNTGEKGATMNLLFPAGGANLYAYSQLAGVIYSNGV